MCLYFLFLVLYAFQQNKELPTLINFYAIVAVCYISVLPENVKKPKVFRGYSNGTMGQNELIYNNDSIDSVTTLECLPVNIVKFLSTPILNNIC